MHFKLCDLYLLYPFKMCGFQESRPLYWSLNLLILMLRTPFLWLPPPKKIKKKHIISGFFIIPLEWHIIQSLCRINSTKRSKDNHLLQFSSQLPSNFYHYTSLQVFILSILPLCFPSSSSYCHHSNLKFQCSSTYPFNFSVKEPLLHFLFTYCLPKCQKAHAWLPPHKHALQIKERRQ